jgi:hypothetical protein
LRLRFENIIISEDRATAARAGEYFTETFPAALSDYKVASGKTLIP